MRSFSPFRSDKKNSFNFVLATNKIADLCNLRTFMRVSFNAKVTNLPKHLDPKGRLISATLYNWHIYIQESHLATLLLGYYQPELPLALKRRAQKISLHCVAWPANYCGIILDKVTRKREVVWINPMLHSVLISAYILTIESIPNIFRLTSFRRYFDTLFSFFVSLLFLFLFKSLFLIFYLVIFLFFIFLYFFIYLFIFFCKLSAVRRPHSPSAVRIRIILQPESLHRGAGGCLGGLRTPE